MSAHSLRVRLLAGAAVWIVLALIAAGIVIVSIFASSVEQDQYEDLRASLDRVLTAISEGGDISSVKPGLSDPRYDTVAGGLYWQVVDQATGVTAQSRSLWDAGPLAEAALSEGRLSTSIGPNNKVLSVLSQDVLQGEGNNLRRFRVSVAEDSALRGRDIRMFAINIAMALSALAAALVLAGWLQVYLGLRPLESIHGALEDVAAGKRDKLEGSFPLEVQPLISEVNSLLANHERSVAVARARADDLAHGLKTPLAVLSATAERLRAKGDDGNAGVLQLLGEEMAERVDYQLRLAQLRVRAGEHTLTASLDQALIPSVAVLRKTGRGADLYWKLDTEKVLADMDSHDLMELIGVLLENAANWAKSEVTIGCRLTGDMAEFELADDGPGLSDEDIAKLGQRGKRLDETRSGTGFGIAIASEILKLNSGTISLSRSPAGGLRVLVHIPAIVG